MHIAEWDMKASRNMWLVMVLLGLGGAILLITLLVQHGIADIAAAAAAARWGLVAVVVFHVVPMFLDVMGWRTLFPHQQRPPALRLFWMRWMGESVSALLPVAQVGGDIVRIRLAALRDASLPMSVATVLVDMTLSVVTQIIFLLSGLVLLLMLTGQSSLTWPVLISALIGFLLIGGFYAVQRLGMFRIMGWLINRLTGSIVQHGLMQQAHAWDQDIRAVYARRGDVLICALWTLGTWATGAIEMWIAFQALGVPASYWQAYVLESMGQGIRSSMFLVPGALGVQESGYLAVGMLLGIPANTVLALAMIRRVRELAFAVPGLIAWQWLEGRLLRRADDAIGQHVA